MYLLYNYINNFSSDFCIYLKYFSKKLKCRKLKYLNAILRFLKRSERLYSNNRNEKSACRPYDRFGYTYAEITAYGDNRNYSHYLPYHLDNACSYRNNALSESLQCTSQRQKRIQSIVELTAVSIISRLSAGAIISTSCSPNRYTISTASVDQP